MQQTSTLLSKREVARDRIPHKIKRVLTSSNLSYSRIFNCAIRLPQSTIEHIIGIRSNLDKRVLRLLI